MLAGLVPHHWANQIDRLEPYGMIIVIILIFTGIYKFLVLPLFALFYSVLVNPIIGPLLGG